MPDNSYLIFKGILRLTIFGYALEVEGGRMWRLYIMAPDPSLLNQQVIAEVSRSGLEVLDVHRIRPVHRARAAKKTGKRP